MTFIVIATIVFVLGLAGAFGYDVWWRRRQLRKLSFVDVRIMTQGLISRNVQ